MTGLRPDVDRYVQEYLTSFRAPVKKGTQFGFGGRVRTRKPGERLLYAPDGTPFRVIENPDGGTQIEQNDCLHAVARPGVLRIQTTTTLEN
jgi:hypothetical protein